MSGLALQSQTLWASTARDEWAGIKQYFHSSPPQWSSSLPWKMPSVRCSAWCEAWLLLPPLPPGYLQGQLTVQRWECGVILRKGQSLLSEFCDGVWWMRRLLDSRLSTGPGSKASKIVCGCLRVLLGSRVALGQQIQAVSLSILYQRCHWSYLRSWTYLRSGEAVQADNAQPYRLRSEIELWWWEAVRYRAK